MRNMCHPTGESAGGFVPGTGLEIAKGYSLDSVSFQSLQNQWMRQRLEFLFVQIVRHGPIDFRAAPGGRMKVHFGDPGRNLAQQGKNKFERHPPAVCHAEQVRFFISFIHGARNTHHPIFEASPLREARQERSGGS
jgi:hypothetical protein